MAIEAVVEVAVGVDELAAVGSYGIEALVQVAWLSEVSAQ